MANRQPPIIIGNRRPNAPQGQAQPPPAPPAQRAPPLYNGNGAQPLATPPGQRVPAPNNVNGAQPLATPPGQRVPAPNNGNGAQQPAAPPGQRVPAPNNVNGAQQPAAPPGQRVPMPNNVNGAQPPAAPPGQWQPAKPFTERPPIPPSFEGWQWVKVVEGKMGDQSRPAPFAQADGKLPPANAFMMSGTVTCNDLFVHPAFPGMRNWDYIIPGRKAQFAMSFARVENGATSLMMPQSGFTTTARTPVWQCRFGNQAFHNFSWPAGGPIVLNVLNEKFVEVLKDVDKKPLPGGGALISVRAQFLGPVPQELRWQLWHLRQPNDAQPLGDQNSRTNGLDVILQNLNEEAQKVKDALKDAPKREKQVRDEFIKAGQAGPHVDYDNEQSAGVLPNNAHSNVEPLNARQPAAVPIPNVVPQPPPGQPRARPRDQDSAFDPLGGLNNPAGHGTNGSAANKEGASKEEFDLFNQ
jgi:hypothetical protein